jgi:dolichol-phosphate mannosyltransferase
MKKEPRLKCFHRAGKLGLGTATIAGMKHAIEQDYDQMLNMDADFSHHPRYIPDLLAAMESADVAIGSR